MTCQSLAPNFNFSLISGANNKIISFTTTLGLGDQSSTLSIEYSGHHGDTKEIVGKVGIFKCNNFSFGGLTKSVVHSDGPGGPKTKVDLVDCKEYCARFQIIMNEFHGTTDVVASTGSATATASTGWNVINTYRNREESSWGGFIKTSGLRFDYGKNLPDAGRNCNSFGISTGPGKVAQGSSTYEQIVLGLSGSYVPFDQTIKIYISELLQIARQIPYAGTAAKSMTLLELINNICEEAGYDWTLHNVKGGNIRIGFINKKQQTTFGEIQNIIESAKTDNTLINYSIGAEYKTEKTRKIVSGSKVNYVKEIYNDAGGNSAFCLGFQQNGWPILGYTSDFNVPINTESLRVALITNGSNFYSSHYLSESELLATGTIGTWTLYGMLNPRSIARSCLNACGLDWQTGLAKVYSSFGSDAHTVSMACVEAVKFANRKSVGAMVYEDVCYPWIKNFYDTWYGKYYMVFVPKKTCVFDYTGYTLNTGIFLGSGSGAYMMDEPNDSGWADTANPIQYNGRNRALFMDGSQKTLGFVGIKHGDTLNRFMGPYNRNFVFEPSSLQGEWDYDNNYVYTRMDADGRCYNYGEKLGVLVKMSSMIPQRAIISPRANCMGLRMLDLLVGDANGFSQFGGTTDFSYTNVFKETLAAGRPNKIALPMKSNVMTYGPFFTNNPSEETTTGGVEYVQVDDLNPWTYAGYSNMVAAGTRIANDGLATRTKYESGSYTLAGLPTMNMGDGGTEGVGPLLNSIVCKIDAGGATTTYNFQTYVQKFGQSAETLNNYTKLQLSSRRANFNALKDNNLEIIRAFSEAMRTNGTIREKFFEQLSQPLTSSASSLNSVLMLSYPDGSRAQRAEVGIDKKYTSDYHQDGDNYSAYGIVSLDMIFSPIMASPYAQSSYMANIRWPLFNHNYFPNAPKHRVPPILGRKRIEPILSGHLNPYTSRAMMSAFSGRASGSGFDTEYVAFGPRPANTFAANAMQKNYRDSVVDFRAAALKGPLLLHSWGYDINGDPVPGTKGANPRFDNNWLRNPKSWPCGPIDLRWDEARGVWVSPPSPSLVIAKLTQDLYRYGSARAEVKNIPGFYNYNIEGGEIMIYDFLGRGILKDTMVLAYHFGSGPDYIAIDREYTFVKGQAGCDDDNEQGVGEPMKQQDGYLFGFAEQGKPALYDMRKLFGQEKLSKNSGKTQVLGYTNTNKWGVPCMTGITMIDCDNQYVGAPDDYFGTI